MSPTLLPDAEALVIDYLAQHEDILELIGEGRVSDEIPSDTDTAFIRTRPIAPGVDDALPVVHLATSQVQVECYGKAGQDGKKTASALLRTTIAALDEAPQAAHERGVVTAVKFGAAPQIDDPDMEPARPRYVLDVFVTLHAHPES